MRFGAGILLIIAGTLRMVQEFDVAFAPQSFMTDNRQWVLWGALAVIGGGRLIWSRQRNVASKARPRS